MAQGLGSSVLRNQKEQEEPTKEIKKELPARKEENQDSVVFWRSIEESVAWRKARPEAAWRPSVGRTER